jgi:hypothetical protein
LWSKRKEDTTHDHSGDDTPLTTSVRNKRKRDARSGDDDGMDPDKPAKKRGTQNNGAAKEVASDSERSLRTELMARGSKPKAR